MNSLYIVCQPWQLDSVRECLRAGETVGTNSHCFRRNTYVVTTNYEVSEQKQAEARHTELRKKFHDLGINVPLQ